MLLVLPVPAALAATALAPMVIEYHQRMLEPLSDEERAMLDQLIDKLAGEGVRRIEG